MKKKLPRNVALGELYAKYSLLLLHAGNSFCCSPSASSSLRFQGNWVSMAVGVVTRVSPVEQQQIYTQIIQFAFELESWEISMGKTKFICDVDLQTR